MPLNLVVLGPPGAGKGTQAERFARSRGIPKISTGDILREAVDGRVKAVMSRGELVGDDLMIGIVRERLGRDDARKGFVLDGFPRTVAQAAALDDMMRGSDPLVIIDIVVPQEELVRRLGTRMICSECGANADAFRQATEAVATIEEAARCQRCGGRLVQRTDDRAEVVLERLKVYHCQTAPLVEYYKRRPTFRSVDGAQLPDRVAADLAAAIDAARNGALR